MARTSLLWLFQLLPFLTVVAANSGFNTTLDNCIHFEMANLEELMSATNAVKNPQINALNGNETEHQLFGSLKSDWSRLHLLREALPDVSPLKNKFKHLIRLLIVAHDQATRFLLLSVSTKFQDAFQKQTTVSLGNEDRTTNPKKVEHELLLSSKSQKESKILKILSTTPTSIFTQDTNSNPGIASAKSIEYGVEAIAVKSMTKVAAEHSENKEIKVPANTADLDPPTNPTARITILEVQESSNANNILIPVTTISKEIITSSSVGEKSRQSTVILEKSSKRILPTDFSPPFVKHITASTRTILNEEFKESSTSAEYSSLANAALTKIQSFTWTSSENPLKPRTEESEVDTWPVITVDPMEEESLVTEEYSSAATVSGSLTTIKQSFLPTPRHKLLTSLARKAENISWLRSTMNPLLSNKATTLKSVEPISNKAQTQSTLEGESTRLESEIRDPSGTSSKLSSIVTTPIVNGTIVKNQDNAVASQKNGTEIDTVMTEKSIANVSTTKHSMKSTTSVTSTIEQDENRQLTNNKVENSLYVKLTQKVASTTDSTKGLSTDTPKIDKSKLKELKREDNETEISTKEASNDSTRQATSPIESISGVSPRLIEINNKSDSISEDNESVPNDEDPSSAPEVATSVSATLQTATNTRKLIGKTLITEAPNNLTQNSVSVDLPTKGQETSTRNLPDGRSIITTKKIQLSISSLPKNTEIPEGESTTENNVEITSKEVEDIRAVTQTFAPLSQELTKIKPYFVKNPLNIATFRNNSMYQVFKHGSNDSGIAKNLESGQIVLYESGATGVKSGGSVWRPHLARQPPVGNNIWLYDSFSKNIGPYRQVQPGSTADTKSNIRNGEMRSAKFPGQGSRMNLLRSRKRGSANADIDKQLRWFYRQGQADTAPKPRDKENGNRKIKIQCKKAHRD